MVSLLCVQMWFYLYILTQSSLCFVSLRFMLFVNFGNLRNIISSILFHLIFPSRNSIFSLIYAFHKYFFEYLLSSRHGTTIINKADKKHCPHILRFIRFYPPCLLTSCIFHLYAIHQVFISSALYSPPLSLFFSCILSTISFIH